MSCREYFYDKIGAIEAIPDNCINFHKPFNMEKKGMMPSFSITGDKKKNVPMKKKSGVIKESVNTSVAGDSYEISLKWEIEKITEETYVILDGLKNEINHLIIRTFSDEGYFIRSVYPGYSFEYYESDGMITCELSITSTTGLQRLSD